MIFTPSIKTWLIRVLIASDPCSVSGDTSMTSSWILFICQQNKVLFVFDPCPVIRSAKHHLEGMNSFDRQHKVCGKSQADSSDPLRVKRLSLQTTSPKPSSFCLCCRTYHRRTVCSSRSTWRIRVQEISFHDFQASLMHMKPIVKGQCSHLNSLTMHLHNVDMDVKDMDDKVLSLVCLLWCIWNLLWKGNVHI